MAEYTVSQIECEGVQATGTFYGTPRKGWLMPDGTFVDYAGFAQVVMPSKDAEDLQVRVWHRETANAKDLAREASGAVGQNG